MDHLKEDFDSLVARTALSDGADRRTFLKTAVGSGFALSVLPVMAQTVIKTDTAGLTAGPVMIDVKGEKIPAYRAQPEGKTDLPVVLIVSEVWGVHEYIADVARRFAKEGYLAIAPELFVRQGDAKAEMSIAELLKNIVSKVSDEQVIGDFDACVAWAAKNGGNTAKVGITGFCWGGRYVWMYAAHNPKIKAGVAWYGKVMGDSTPLTPKNPIDIAASLKVPVLGLYGGKDNGISQESLEKMKEALAKGNSGSQIVVFPNSGHAFHADYRPSYVEADAKEGWSKCLAWFKTHGLA
jgi:carboxymethylenebutenolidase